MLSSGVMCGGQFISNGALALRAASAAALFEDAGVGPADRVALLCGNAMPFLEATLGARQLGAYAVPINWHLAIPEIDYVLQDCEPVALVAETAHRAAIQQSRVAQLQCFEAGSHLTQKGWRSWDDGLNRPPLQRAAADTVDTMIYTSGTTGRPKGVKRLPATTEQREAARAVRTRIYSAEPGMRVLIAAPLYHSAPNFLALNTIANDGLLVLEKKFDAERTLQLIEQHRVTHMFLVPTMMVRLLALPDDVKARYDVGSLRWVLHAGAPCPPAVKFAMIAWWGPVLAEYYGATELGPLTFVAAADWLARPGTVGQALPGIDLLAIGADGRRCAPGIAGEICVARNVNPDFTYHGDDQKRRSLDTDSGILTGDIGYFSSEGYLFLCDRRVDMIISGGVNIYPAEIEAALITVPGVLDCAVIGVPDAEFGETVLAYIECEPEFDVDEEAVLTELRGRIAGYKVPRQIHIVDALPRDDSGKLFKRKLREQAALADHV